MQMVEWNEDRMLGGASQFQPPSPELLAQQPVDQPIAGLDEIGARGQDPSVDTGHLN